MNVKRAALYWHTLRHLKLVQFYGRLFRMRNPKADLSPAPALRAPSGVAQPPARRAPSMFGPREFRFLNETGGLDRGWDDERRTKLWLYNLHYFDDLNAEGAESRDAWHVALMDEWIKTYLPGAGTGWEPYPTSLRIVNWIKRHLDGRPLSAEQRESLAVQVRWLTRRLEWHLLGNHLFANAKALVMAGLVFDGPEAERWLARGMSIVDRELPEQVLPDGGNFERSPMYHSIFLEDLLDLINVAQTYPEPQTATAIDRWRETAGRMLDWLQAICHPDHEISLFNDAAIGIAPSPAELVGYAGRLGIAATTSHDAAALVSPKVTLLPESGYVRMENASAVALLDVAPVGPDYLPGHAHADTLSFELSVFGQRLIVNGGTSAYGLGTERQRERGTTAHSTVVIDGQDSSEVWGGFRVARRARPFDLAVSTRTDEAVVACSHDGYRRLPGRPVHRREWSLRAGALRVWDKVEGGFKTAEARYHFHPDTRVQVQGEGRLTLERPGRRQIRLQVAQGHLRIESSRYADAFGEVRDTTCAVVSLLAGPRGAEACIDVDWT